MDYAFIDSIVDKIQTFKEEGYAEELDLFFVFDHDEANLWTYLGRWRFDD